MPREPRVITDDTHDLADYMRSTRPTQETPMVPLVQSPVQNGAAAVASATSRQRLVAREPDIGEDGTGDLIDFIRQGPPGSKPSTRAVAPFRSTMDSDELNSYGDFSQGSKSSTRKTGATTAPPVGRMAPAIAPRTAPTIAPAPNRSAGASGMPQIVKKQRRVKDPYAIDSDEDEDDYLTSLPGGRAVQAPKEESLADFLRNSEPPSNNTPKVLPVGPNPRFMSGSSAARPTSRSVNSGFGGPSAVPQSPRSAMSGSMKQSKPRFEARAAGATRNGFGGNGFYYSTNDMADFLRSSGPVDNMNMRTPNPSVPELVKKPSRRGRLFGQR